MDVRLSEEHNLVQQTAGQLARDHAFAIRPNGDSLPDSSRAWQALSEIGFIGLRALATAGGAEATALDAALVVEQLARQLTAVPYIGQAVLAPELAHLGGNESLVRDIIGGARVTVALDQSMTRLAHIDEAAVIWDAQGADDVLLLDRRDRVCRSSAAGDRVLGLDLTREVRHRSMGEAVPVSSASLSGDDQLRFAALAFAMVAAALVGVAQSALDAAVAYVTDRVQFGAPVGSFQAVQHLAATAAVLVEGARSSMWHAAWAVDALAPRDALLAARQAKAYCSRAGREVCEISVQLHGGIAITWEHLAHVRLRRALFMATSFGDVGTQLRAIADHRLGAA
jgi:alkylation response protein AidB-like acyl-CoA dehydrogenase